MTHNSDTHSDSDTRGNDNIEEPTHGDPGVERTSTVPKGSPHENPDSPEDVETDPALDDRLGSDWIDEGGATSVGPATSVPGGVETEESKRQVRIDREREEKEEENL
ncbi:hypothetical protein [Leucobacter denitrificans]|uniref:Uncharacterized protein n=1 Tax=Leucobacter denitrificans TaxID=683042 RepID=A0A7G9S879_9MICO|nr:hypothetical protein [Leucobacter denitrificans]QNN64054.1 hypothetical protein H9L06_03295 [Leucobacter denitrificans]